MIKVTVQEACEILNAIGCGSDPVTYWGGGEASDILYDVDESLLASKVRIGFFLKNCQLMVRGTLKDLIADRLGVLDADRRWRLIERARRDATRRRRRIKHASHSSASHRGSPGKTRC